MVSSDDIEGVTLCDDGKIGLSVDVCEERLIGLWVIEGIIAVTIVALSRNCQLICS